MYVGIDCGTQSTKVVLIDADNLAVVGEASAPHTLQSGDNGRREQSADEWIAAFETAFTEAVTNAGIDRRAIEAIGVSGQQHSLVAVDHDNRPVHPAKLWCDTETAPENAEIVDALGGTSGCLDQLGVVPQPGFTISKIAWLRRYRPEAYRRIDALLLPHDYINCYLTGERTSEDGDASGTGYFDTRTRQWAPDVLRVAAPELDPARVLPRLVAPDEPAGTVRYDVAERLGLGTDVTVAAGGGDNMMAAIGTGNIEAGTVTLSLGSSGTIFAHSDAPAIADNAGIANFCTSHGGWLPLACTMNVTAATQLVATAFNMATDDFSAAIASAPIGADGVIALPFFNGERVPPLPSATGNFDGLTPHNFNQANLCRATVEGATCGLVYGLDHMASLGVQPDELRLVGGGARNAVWRQIVADITNRPVVAPVVGEAAALGGAIQAAWCHQRQRGEAVTMKALADQAVRLDDQLACTPIESNVVAYRAIYQHYLDTLTHRYPDVPRPTVDTTR
ncbi:xylulokinase [Salinisphaera sp. USBA-960]|nr:xylulokinase [Salifodinibacter halophilus]NNC26415.1 xylulokinase [Salifodinibacter halophilus]